MSNTAGVINVDIPPEFFPMTAAVVTKPRCVSVRARTPLHICWHSRRITRL